MTMKKFHALVAVVGLVAVSSAAWFFQRTGHSPASSSSSANASAVSAAGKGADGKGGNTGPSAPVPVEAAPVQVTRLQDSVQAVGSLRSRQGVMLRPESSGRVARLGFSDGQRVKRGQVLVQLDDTLQRAQRLQATAQASIARTTLQRNRELAEQNFVSKSAVDQSAAALEVAEAQVALADAQLLRMRIVAPFDGVTGIRVVNVGDYVKDGADLVNVNDITALLVDFRLPESAVTRLKVGQDVEVTLDSTPGRIFKGQVEAIDSQLDANGRSLLVRALLDNTQGVLRPGMFARADIVFAVRDKAIVVPEEALVPQNGKQYVLKLEKTATGFATRRIEARLGLRVPGKAEILEGLAAGDRVVTAGQARLMRADGLPVTVVQVGVVAPAASSASAAKLPASAQASGAARPR
ncbi:MAG: hypothetical protein RLZZ618_3428 [Pseudomonadota bacterium]